MKKILAILLILVLTLGTFTACGGAKEEAPAAEPMVVGFLYVGPIGDGGFTYAHDQGR